MSTPASAGEYVCSLLDDVRCKMTPFFLRKPCRPLRLSTATGPCQYCARIHASDMNIIKSKREEWEEETNQVSVPALPPGIRAVGDHSEQDKEKTSIPRSRRAC
jgi:hypothetical protein